MVKEVIDGIKATEASAARLIEDARKKKAEIVAKAREEAKSLVEGARTKGAADVKQALGKAEEEASRRTEEIAGDEQKTREALQQSSSGNIPKAVDAVIKRMLD
ncbi:MAG: HrpE/YscL family type III secretion apparatus protein [Candidatus Eisenbacteria bacterium]